MPEPSNPGGAPEEKRRRWYRLHRSTWAVLVLTSCVLVLLIVPGEYSDYPPAGEILGLRPLTFEHGWPWVYLRRQVELPPNTPPAALPHHAVPWLQGWAWSFEGDLNGRPAWAYGDAVQWKPWALALDGLAAVAILGVAAAGLERRRRRRRIWQFSLKELLGLTLLIAAALGWWKLNAQRSERERDVVNEFSRSSFRVDYRGPLWLRRAAGIAHLQPFVRVVGVYISDLSLTRKADHLELLKRLDEFPHLEELIVRSQSIRNTDLRHVGHLLHLRELDFRKTPSMTDVGLGHLRNLRRLRRLEVENSKGVTSDGLRHLSAMKELELLRLSGTGIDNRGLRYVAQLSRLEILDLADTAVDDGGLRQLGGLTNLRQLGLAGTGMEGSGLVHLRSLKRLQTLNLDRTALGDDHLAHLEGLENLARLDVRQTRITRAGAERLRKALPQCQVIWRPRSPAD